MPPEAKDFYGKRQDVERLPTHIAIDIPESFTEINNAFQSQIDSWLCAVKLDDLGLKHYGDAPKVYRQDECTLSHTKRIIEVIREGREHDVFAPLDRDVKRAACMDIAGYMYRM